VNTFLAETFDPDEGDEIIAGDIGARMEERPEFLPEAIEVITCGVDVQEDRLELEVVGHCGPDGTESYGIEYRILRGDTSLPEVWKKLDEFLMSSNWKREDGPILRIQACGIDSGFRASHVYEFCRGKAGQRIVPIKGQSGFHVPLIGRGTQTRIGGVKVYSVGSDNAKAIVHQRLRINEPGPGYTHFWYGGGYDQEYFEQLTAEKIVKKFARGKLSGSEMRPWTSGLTTCAWLISYRLIGNGCQPATSGKLRSENRKHH
jgi:phage terminase large subunit GpA-like protein